MSYPCRAVMSALVALFACLLPAAAQAEPGQDHPLLSRYPGSEIRYYDFREYEQAQLLLSRPHDRNGRPVVDKLLPLEGRVTYINYEAPSSASTLQVFRNYQAGLQRSGFKTLFVCERPCGNWNLTDFRDLIKSRDLYVNGAVENQYLAAQRGNTYVSLWVNQIGGRTQAFLFVIEKTAIDDGRIAVAGDNPIARALNSDGKVDLYGFLFDSGEAALKSSSMPTLKQLGQVLRENPDLKLDIVGHTDDVGGVQFNQRLSEARARAVVTALVTQQGIDSNRLNPSGKGASEALAPNTSEAGRAKNRRVEVIAHGKVEARPDPQPAARSTATSNEPPHKADGPRLPTVQDANTVIDMAARIKDILRR